MIKLHYKNIALAIRIKLVVPNKTVIIASTLIDSLDESGYLQESIEIIYENLKIDREIDAEQFEIR